MVWILKTALMILSVNRLRFLSHSLQHWLKIRRGRLLPDLLYSISKESLKLSSSSFLRLFEAVCFFNRSLVFVVYLRSHLALKQAVKQEMRLSVGSVGSCIGLRESEWVGGAHHKCFSVCDILQSTNKPDWIQSQSYNQSLHNRNALVPLQRFSLRYPIWGCLSSFSFFFTDSVIWMTILF